MTSVLQKIPTEYRMKLSRMGKGISYSIVGIFYVLGSSSGNAGAMGPALNPSGNIYAGVFGGAGAANTIDNSQFGTAFLSDIAGGPLAVNAVGKVSGRLLVGM